VKRLFLTGLVTVLTVLTTLRFFILLEPVSASIGPSVIYRNSSNSSPEPDFYNYGYIRSVQVIGYTSKDPGVWCKASSAVGLSWVPDLNSWIWTSFYPNKGDQVVFRPYVQDTEYTSIWVTEDATCSSNFLEIIAWRTTYGGLNFPLDR
jgi:hypothetical protein